MTSVMIITFREFLILALNKQVSAHQVKLQIKIRYQDPSQNVKSNSEANYFGADRLSLETDRLRIREYFESKNENGGAEEESFKIEFSNMFRQQYLKYSSNLYIMNKAPSLTQVLIQVTPINSSRSPDNISSKFANLSNYLRFSRLKIVKCESQKPMNI
ncbi:hypothetical protein MP228_000336 [Amoeboaphelidium protococcarum]|nr:hypothetical protein MP228_000336 [Amoeboaphelidium protococcarum]